jgi:hypothetical protein
VPCSWESSGAQWGQLAGVNNWEQQQQQQLEQQLEHVEDSQGAAEGRQQKLKIEV